MQTFVQTENFVIDVSKVTHMCTPKTGKITVYFHGGTLLLIDREEAELLMAGIKELSLAKVLAVSRSAATTR